MSVVIVGGNEGMECRYKEICKQFGCKAKIFTKIPGNFKGKIGSPDLLVLFTNTVSHRMVNCALQDISGQKTVVARCHSSSSCALKSLLDQHCKVCENVN